MKIYKIDKENRDLFTELDPFFMMTEAGIGDGEMLGAFMKDSEGFDVPAGIIVYSIRKDRVSVLWLYVLPKYRNRNIGVRLLQKAISLANTKGLKYVEARFSDFPTRKSFCVGEEEFFKSQGFNIDLYNGEEWLGTVRQMLTKPFLSDVNPGKEIVSLSSFPEKEQIHIIHRLAKKAEFADYNLSDNTKDKIDYETSFVMNDITDNISGALLCYRDDALYHLGLFAGDDTGRKALIKASLSRTAQLYGSDTVVKIPAGDDVTRAFLTKTMEGKGLRYYTLAAETSDLVNYSKLNMSYIISDEIPEYRPSVQSKITDLFKEGEDITRTLEDIGRIEVLSKGDISDNVINIGQLNIRELFRILNKCGECGHNGVLATSPDFVDYMQFDHEVSSVYRENGKIKAVFITSAPIEGVIYPLILFAEKKDDMKLLLDLLKFSSRKAVELYPSDSVVSIRCYDEASRNLCAKLVK